MAFGPLPPNLNSGRSCAGVGNLWVCFGESSDSTAAPLDIHCSCHFNSTATGFVTEAGTRASVQVKIPSAGINWFYWAFIFEAIGICSLVIFRSRSRLLFFVKARPLALQDADNSRVEVGDQVQHRSGVMARARRAASEARVIILAPHSRAADI